MAERLQKILSQAGICSRRAAEKYLSQGRITVNGTVAGLGDQADLGKDVICLDGNQIKEPEGVHTYLMLYKPRGVVTTLADERGRWTVADLVTGCPARIWPVGRLDMDSEGLLLLTNDGILTNDLLHPSREIEKEYLTWVTGDVEKALPLLEQPMTVEGEHFYPARVRILQEENQGQTLLSIVIHEGKKRQIRRMCAHCGVTVRRLKRIREGALQLDPALRPGQWRPLTQGERDQINRDAFLQD